MNEETTTVSETVELSERERIALAGIEVVAGPRQEIYGDPVEAHQEIADIATVILGRKLLPGARIEAHEVALLQIGLKIVRAKNSPTYHKDSFVDIVGYASIAGEARSQKL